MKKVLSSILISFIIFANLFAPFSVGISKKNNIEINKNEVEAAPSIDKTELTDTSVSFTVNEIVTNVDAKISVKSIQPEKSSYSQEKLISAKDNKTASVSYTFSDLTPGVSYNIIVETGTKEFPTILKNLVWISFTTTKPGDQTQGTTTGEYNLKIDADVVNTDTTATATANISKDSVAGILSNGGFAFTRISMVASLKDSLGNLFGQEQSIQVQSPEEQKTFAFKDLKPENQYKLEIRLERETTFTNPELGTSQTKITNLGNLTPSVIFKTNKSGDQTVVKSGSMGVNMVTNNSKSMPACSITGGLLGGEGTFTGCIAQAFYYALFIPTSYLFALSGVFFDNTFAYSVQDSSYRSSFVVEGWGMVRDFCNMFFIFILLYVAIGTILSLHSMKTKETIINVVVIGLFINFSLFATQLIIDASNITARVFYNADSIKITENGSNGPSDVVDEPNSNGVISLSAALVNKVNPQNLIINAEQINKVGIKGSDAIVQDKQEGGMTAATFIIVVLLASAVNIVGFIVFLSVGMIFISRVVGLWIAMIISPLVFFTYILPEEMAGWKMVGWKNWWPETFKLAFLAPVFIFFMYIILKFLELDILSDAKGKDGLSFLISILMPFAFIMYFLMKAKKMAAEMSGELGQQITSKLSMAGGLALGAATGGAAVLGRATVGRFGNMIANSERLKKAESTGVFGAKMLRNLGTSASKGSFDVRNTKAGAAFSKETGIDTSGKGTGLGGFVKANEGGFAKVRADKLAERTKRSKELELGEDSKEKQKLNTAEATLKRLEDETSPEIHSLDGKIKARQTDATDKARRAASLESIVDRAGKDANGKSLATETQIKEAQEARAAARAVDEELQGFKNDKKAIRNGEGIKDHHTGEIKYYTDNGKITKSESEKQVEITKRESELAEAKAKEEEAYAAQVEADASLSQAEKESARTMANDARILANNTKAKHDRIMATHTELDAKKGFGKSMDTVEYEDIHHAKQEYDKENNTRKLNYADYIQNDKLNKVANFISTGGVHSYRGDREAGHKIRMNIQVEKSSSGSHGGASHAAPAPAHEEKPEGKDNSHGKAHDDGGHGKAH